MQAGAAFRAHHLAYCAFAACRLGGELIRAPASLPRPGDNLRALIEEICLIWEEDRPLYRRVMALREVDPEVREVIEEREAERSLAIDAISHRLIARYARRATVEALWALTGFPIFDSMRRHATFDDVVEMITSMAVTTVDPDKLWEVPRPSGEGGDSLQSPPREV